jgi:acyl-coenzyme A synthetase/AMP-(fatty) acid ligase
MLVHGILDQALTDSAQAEAVRDATGSWTYHELDGASRRAARWLAGKGVGIGGRVVVQALPDRRVVALFYACSRLGAVFVPVAPGTKPFQLGHIYRDAEPVLGIGNAADVGVPVHGLDEPFQAAAAGGSASRAPAGDAATDPSRTLLLFYTSGSTAMPKAVVCPHARVDFAARAVADRLAYRPDDVVFCRLPLSFDYGFYQVLLTALARATLVLADATADARLAAQVIHHGATVVPLVPALALMLSRLAGRGTAAAAVRLFTNTGEEMPPAAVARLRAAYPGAGVQLMFGLTECKRVSILDVDGDLAKPGSVGTPLPGTAVRIVDDRGAVLPPGEPGQIIVTGPHVMDGYWRAPELTSRVFRHQPDGTVALHTGDVGHLDRDGHLYFHGRNDQIFKRRGVRTSVQEIEAAALDVPGVREAALLPPAAGREAELILATDLTAAESLVMLRERLDAAKVPDRCRIVPTLPRTANGKIDRTALARMGHG